MRRHRRKIESEAEVNLTPLIDVVFVILIMFIVVAPLLEIEQIELAGGPSLEQSNVSLAQESSALTIHVFADDSITINKQPISSSQLRQVFSAFKERMPTARPQLFHDKNAKFGTYQTVKTALEAAGFTEMEVVLKPE